MPLRLAVRPLRTLQHREIACDDAHETTGRIFSQGLEARGEECTWWASVGFQNLVLECCDLRLLRFMDGSHERRE